MRPTIITEEVGHHNADLSRARDRLMKGATYRDLSTVIVVPTRGTMRAEVVRNWWSMWMPMNQKVVRWFVIGMEVGEAYTAAIENILANDDLKDWRYVLTLEEDNLPPPDGLLKLYEELEALPKDYAAVSGLYWTKGDGGQPMAYGNPQDSPLQNFIPWLPDADSTTQVYGIGMGFALWRMEFFKDERLPRPLFLTAPNHTQDLYACGEAGKHGWKFAVTTKVLVGHIDQEGQVW